MKKITSIILSIFSAFLNFFNIGCSAKSSIYIPDSKNSFKTEKIIFGVHSALEYLDYDDKTLQESINRMKLLNVKISRNGILWNKIEPIKGQKNWEYTDKFINALNNNNIEPLIVIANTSPAWANNSTNPFFVPNEEEEFNQWLNDYKEFIKEAVLRYKNKIKYYELGNEPNINSFWYPVPNSYYYSKWAKEIYNIIKEYDPNAIIAGGSLTVINKNWGEEQIKGVKFLQDMFSNGFYPDVISVHPYSDFNDPPETFPKTNANVFKDVTKIRFIMDKNKQEGKPIWITEMGYQIGKKKITSEIQKKYLQDIVKILKRDMKYVNVFIWFWQEDFENSIYNGFGLFNEQKQIREAGIYFKELNQ